MFGVNDLTPPREYTAVAQDYLEHRQRLKDIVSNPAPHPATSFSGRGIVICAGGPRYFTNAWVCVNILRKHGCNLPVQFWHLGPGEMTDEMRELVRPLGVECVDAHEIRKLHPARILNGWELKPYAIIHSPFEEVICLDADNVPLIDPESLFETPEYKQTGAIFWPDYGRLAASRSIWEIMDIAYRDEPEFESGQLVVDKRRCWHALQVTMHLNEWSDFYYSHIHGDKETFHMAWRKLGQEYSMPVRGIHSLAGTMCQHDFHGNRIFQHRNMRKWSLTSANEPVEDFQLEAECFEFLNSLRRSWSASPEAEVPPELLEKANQVINQRYYTYARIGHDFRRVAFMPAGVILAGNNAIEHSWRVTGTSLNPRISIFTPDGTLLTDLKIAASGMLYGDWLLFEKMPCVFIPADNTSGPYKHDIFWAAQYGEDKWLNANTKFPATGQYVEVGVGHSIRNSNTYWLEQLGWRGLLIEADPRNIDDAKQTRAAAVVHCAVSSSDGETLLALHSDSTLSSTVYSLPTTRFIGEPIKIPARRLDTLLPEHGIDAPYIVSIDTEGSELDVLAGLGQIRPAYLIVEYLTVTDHSVVNKHADTAARLTQMGYKIIHETESNLIAQY